MNEQTQLLVDVGPVLDELYHRMNSCNEGSIAISYFAVAILLIEQAAGISSISDGYPARVRQQIAEQEAAHDR